jgi:hypothetical protein
MALTLAPARSFDETPAVDPAVSVGAFGKACRLYGTNDVGPANYRIADLGKLGVPTLTSEQLNVVARIVAHLGTNKTLWFTFLPKGDGSREFVVFETGGLEGPIYPGTVPPCTDDPPGYPVLSVQCDFWYETAEAPSLHLIPSEHPPTPMPWLSPSPC